MRMLGGLHIFANFILFYEDAWRPTHVCIFFVYFMRMLGGLHMFAHFCGFHEDAWRPTHVCKFYFIL
jgi:hypothetical protein